MELRAYARVRFRIFINKVQFMPFKKIIPLLYQFPKILHYNRLHVAKVVLGTIGLYGTTKFYQNKINQKPLVLLSHDKLLQYFDRIGADSISIQQFISGPSLESLCEIHRLQVTKIHVSNSQMQEPERMKMPHPISPFFDDIYYKLVVKRRHGYCFENNQLLNQVLISLGYEVTLCLGHIIRNNVPHKEPLHAILIAKIKDKKYLVDAGYGGMTPIGVIECEVNKRQINLGKPWRTMDSSGNVYRFTASGEYLVVWVLQTYFDEIQNKYLKKWTPLYMFREKPCSFEDFIKANQFTCKDYPSFERALFKTKFGNKYRVGLTQNELRITRMGEDVHCKPVVSQEKFNKYLKKYFDDSEETKTYSDRVKFGENITERCRRIHLEYKAAKKHAPLHLKHRFWAVRGLTLPPFIAEVAEEHDSIPPPRV